MYLSAKHKKKGKKECPASTSKLVALKIETSTIRVGLGASTSLRVKDDRFIALQKLEMHPPIFFLHVPFSDEPKWRYKPFGVFFFIIFFSLFVCFFQGARGFLAC